MKTYLLAAAVSMAALISTPSFAETDHGAHHVDAAGAAASMTDGTVKKVDKAAGKMTIAHGPLENLGMPGMTMVFRVKDPAMLERVKAGDKIRFAAEKINGGITVVQLEQAQ